MSDRMEFGMADWADIEEHRKPTTIPRTVSVTRAQEQEIARLTAQQDTYLSEINGLIKLANTLTKQRDQLVAEIHGWATSGRNHGGNPYVLDFVRTAEKIIEEAQ